MVLAVHRAGRADRTHHRHPGPALRPEPDLRGDGERWPPAALVRARPSEAQNPLHEPARHRQPCRGRRRGGADRCPEPARGRRHAVRLHPGLRCGHLSAVGRTPGPSALSRAHVPWVPLLGILACLGLMSGLAPLTWLRLVSWLVIGLVVYFAYGGFPSRLSGGR